MHLHIHSVWTRVTFRTTLRTGRLCPALCRRRAPAAASTSAAPPQRTWQRSGPALAYVSMRAHECHLFGCYMSKRECIQDAGELVSRGESGRSMKSSSVGHLSRFRSLLPSLYESCRLSQCCLLILSRNICGWGNAQRRTADIARSERVVCSLAGTYP